MKILLLVLLFGLAYWAVVKIAERAVVKQNRVKGFSGKKYTVILKKSEHARLMGRTISAFVIAKPTQERIHQVAVLDDKGAEIGVLESDNKALFKTIQTEGGKLAAFLYLLEKEEGVVSELVIK